jgi:hypothetical protein
MQVRPIDHVRSFKTKLDRNSHGSWLFRKQPTKAYPIAQGTAKSHRYNHNQRMGDNTTCSTMHCAYLHGATIENTFVVGSIPIYAQLHRV